MQRPRPDAILIAGPTASGKSGFALKLAEAHGGWIINADASQVYRELRILSARPSDHEMARAPHRLYGHVPAAERYSVARWLEDARAEIGSARAAGVVPIIVGGTGLYFLAALEGLAHIPPIAQDVRRAAAELYDALGGDEFGTRLAALDCDAAARIKPGDRYRMVRAYEVVTGTGKPIGAWFAGAHRPLVDAATTRKLVLMPEREALYAACDARFDQMLAAGALDEVRALLALDLPPTLPAMNALGVAELARHLEGEIGLEEAAALAKRRTRRYAKRQLTWIRNQMADWEIMSPTEARAVDGAAAFG